MNPEALRKLFGEVRRGRLSPDEAVRRLRHMPFEDLGRVLALPGVRDTVNLDHIKHGYYSIKALNPTRIVPVGPELAWAG